MMMMIPLSLTIQNQREILVVVTMLMMMLEVLRKISQMRELKVPTTLLLMGRLSQVYPNQEGH